MINEFRYGQTWQIWPSPLSLSLYRTFKEDGTTPLNIATNVVFVILNPPANYQGDFSLSPRHWLNKSNNFANDILVFENEIFKTFFPLIVTWHIQKNISKSKNDLISITESTDIVQKLIELQEQDNSKTLCVACLNILSKSSNKCGRCGHCPKTQISRDLLYGDVMSQENTRRKNQALNWRDNRWKSQL